MTPLLRVATAYVVYNRSTRGEAACALSRLLKEAGWATDINMGDREKVVFGEEGAPAVNVVSWDEARNRANARIIKPRVGFKRLTETAVLPSKGSSLAAGYDLYYDGPEITLQPNERVVLSTGIAFAPPEGCYGRVAGRSGLAVKGFDTLGGVVDADYTGEIKVTLVWHSCDNLTHTFATGDRIAQLVLERYVDAEVVEVQELTATERGAQGFGSTGR